MSDSPNQAATIQRLKSILSKQDSYQSSLDTIKARLQGEDTTLKSASDLLVRAKEIAVQGANDTLNPADRKSLGTELQALRDQLLSLANTRDSNGNILADGDSVTLIKDLKVKGSGGVTLKRGTLVKNIRLTGDTDEIEANVEKVRGLVLRTEFVKKA